MAGTQPGLGHVSLPPAGSRPRLFSVAAPRLNHIFSAQIRGSRPSKTYVTPPALRSAGQFINGLKGAVNHVK
jgi:hypothetical protein